MNDLNYLGTFDTIDEVYAAYPSGGVPGNYVIVDGIVLYWDENQLRWASRSDDEEPSGDTTVEGVLTADEVVTKDGFRTNDFQEDTQGSALRKSGGKWLLSVDRINVRNGVTIGGEDVVPSGDEGGQVWISTNIDTIVVDCYSDGRAMSAVEHTINVSLYCGSNKCSLTYVRFAFGGSEYAVVAQGTSASRTFKFSQGGHVSSGNITITLKGTYNGTEYTSVKTVPVIANKQGGQGGGIQSITKYYLISASNIGVTTETSGWTDSYEEPTEAYPYLWSYTHYLYTDGTAYDTTPEVLRVYTHKPFPRLTEWQEGKAYLAGGIGEQYMDIVSYMGAFYQCRQTHVSTDTYRPTNSALYWRQAENFGFIASDLVLAKTSIINNLVASSLRTAGNGVPHIVMEGSRVEFYGTLDTPSIVLTHDTATGVGVLRFYDEDGNMMYDLGPNGITNGISAVSSSYEDFYYKALRDSDLVTAVANFSGVLESLTITAVQDSQCTEYHRFNEGVKEVSSVKVYNVSESGYPSSWNGLMLCAEYTDAQLIQGANINIIPDGWYVKSNDLKSGITLPSSENEFYEATAYAFVGGIIARSVKIYISTNDNQMYYDANGNSHRKLGEIFNSSVTPILTR